MALNVRRRQFIAALGGAAVITWPLTARAQQPTRSRRIGVLVPFNEGAPEVQERLTAFTKRLQDLGWTDGHNIQIDYRFTGGNAERLRIGAGELVAVAPDVIFVYADPTVTALMQATHVIPIVFAEVSDPVGSGFVASLARPGGNVTGFHNFETTIGGKWLEVLKQVAPGVRRVAVVLNPDVAANVTFLHSADVGAASLGMTVTAAGVHDAVDIEPALSAFARDANGGLIVAPAPVTIANRELIFAQAAKLRLPAIYSSRFFPKGGGLISYGPDAIEEWRGAATYVDRILRGANPGELPVQLPTRYELVINLKTAKALGLTVPPSLLVAADEVIE
jgi:putative ABC transport system substrate-binding protein